MEVLELVLRAAGALIGWPLKLLLRSIDRLPRRDPSQLAKWQGTGRLALAATAAGVVLLPFAWLVFG